jgi:hypothetical protein
MITASSLFDALPEIGLFHRIHTHEQLSYLQQWGGCPGCERKPKSFEPLDDGWVWDCRAFTIWAWCPNCIGGDEA